MANIDNEGYRVGYGKPPRHAQYQKGQSGNRRGRPKGTLNFASVLRKALLDRVIVNEHGKTRRMSKIDVAIRRQINNAAAGDVQALKLLTSLLLRPAGSTNDLEPITIVISEAESRL